jgi:hypothetical protein
VLPKGYLEVRRYRGKIFPKFLMREDIEIAELVLSVYNRNKGRKLKFVKKELKEMENSENYKKLRGLSKIIEKSIIFKSSTSLSPPQIRKFLFSRGVVIRGDERRKIIEAAAEKFGSSVEDIENSIFADLEEEAIIHDIGIESADDLLRRYNLSLLQTTLFNSLKMVFWTESEHKRIFWALKRLGLMYEIDGGIALTGPASVVKLTRRYGTSFAKLIPLITRSPKWWIKAEILDEYSKRVYRLKVSSEDRILLPETETKVEFDSAFEEELYFRLRASRPDIEILREPEVVKAGDFAFIPDFRLKKGEKEIFIEIAGFWTSDYLKKKVEKIKKADVPLIVIGKEELAEVAPFVISLKEKLPYIRVLKLVNNYFEEIKRDSGLNMALEEAQRAKILNVSGLAKKYDVEVTEIQRKIELEGSKILVGSWLFDRGYVEEVKSRLEKGSGIETLLEKDGIDALLDFLGYRIVWEGVTNARIVKKT